MSTAAQLPTRGRWIRRGGEIVLLPSSAARDDGGMEGEVAVTATQAGVIDSRIDVHAQYALLRMAKGDPSARADASAMLSAVKSGALAGIYKEDQQVPALRARSLGASWWTVIPKGEDAALVREPATQPLLVFRDGVRSNAARLDPALRKAWASYRLWSGGQTGPCGPGAPQPLANVFPGGLCRRTGRRCPPDPSADRAFTAWLSAALARALGRSSAILPVAHTASALRAYQARKGLMPTGRVNGATQRALTADTGMEPPCQLADVVECPDSIGCGDGAFSGTVTAQGITFRFCWSTLAFNFASKGEVDPGPPGTLVFSCHRALAADPDCPRKVKCIPAWEYEAAVIAGGAALGNAADWEFGFLQTVRASRWLALYTKGAPQMCEMANTRDVLAGPAGTPWVMPSGVVGLCGGANATFSDTPRAMIPVAHPDRQGGELRAVCFRGTFDVWLAARRKAAPAGAGGFVRLAFKSVSVDRRWTRPLDRAAGSTGAWTPEGGQAETVQQSGPGPRAPVLSGATANEKAKGCFKDAATASCDEPRLAERNPLGGTCVLPGQCQ